MKEISLIVMLVCLSAVGYAQPIALRFERLTTADGLPSHDLTAVIEDHLGFLWLGGPKGLIRYDGYEPVHYKPEPEDSMSTSGTAAFFIHEDSTGDIWVGTEECIERFDRQTETFSCIVELQDLVWGGRRRLAEGADGIMWAGTTYGLVAIERSSGKVLNRHLIHPEDVDATSKSKNDVTAVLEDGEDSILVGTPNGIYRFDRNDSNFHFLPLVEKDIDASAALAINDIARGPDGAVWIATSCGLYRMDASSISLEPIAPHTPQTANNPCLSVFNIHTKEGQTLWLNTNSGDLFQYDRSMRRWDTYLVLADDHPIYGVSQVIEDRSGVIWLAARSGLYKMNPAVRAFSTLHNTDTSGLRISSVYRDTGGKLWAGTWEGTLLRWDENLGLLVPHMAFPHGIINHMAEDRRGALWVPVNNHGIYRLEPDRTSYTHFKYLPDDLGTGIGRTINRIIVDRDGMVWVATYGDGLSRYDVRSNKFLNYVNDSDDPDSLPRDNIISICEDRTGLLWLALDKGVSRFDKESEQFRFYDIPLTNSLTEDLSGRLWAATADGLYLLDRETGATTVFKTEDGLAHNVALSVEVDNSGYLWIGTANGLSRFDPESRSFTNYSSEDGLASDIFEEDGVFKDKNGELYLVGEGDGRVTVFSPEQVPVNTKAPLVVITDFMIRGEKVEIGSNSPLQKSVFLTRQIVLPYEDRDISISFSALQFERPELNRYAYKLEGHDASYSTPGFQRTATYTNLDPGDYVFRVKAANRDGVWNNEGAFISITVLSPWWLGRYAILVYGLLAVAFLVLLERAHRKRLIRKERRLSVERELERAREIQEMNELLLQHEEQLERQNAQLEGQKNQLETQARQLQELDRAKSRFFANISHEFRTPLTLILGPLENALLGVYGSALESIKEPLRGIYDQACRLLRLVNQLLDLAKLENGKMTLRTCRLDLAVCLGDLVRSFAPGAERKRLTLHYQPEVLTCMIVADRDKLEKIVGNLLSNAIKFTPEGGKVWVTISEPLENPEYVEIVVKDTGLGIPREAIGRLFDRFEQVNASPVFSHEGTGLGLALAKELVELQGGEIEVESEQGFGSSFIVRLPRIVPEAPTNNEGGVQEIQQFNTEIELRQFVPSHAEIERENQDEIVRPQPARPRILLVDDNREVRTFIRGQLEHIYDVIEAADGNDALMQARSIRPNLVLSDVMMPEMDGFELCRRLKKDDALRHIPVVLLTARAGESDTVLGLDCGADDYLAKPFGTAELRARVAGLIRSRNELRLQFSREVVIQPSGVVGQAEDEVFLERTIAIIESNMEDSTFGVGRLASEHGLSRRQLGRRIRLLTNKTPKALIWEIRLGRAAALLETRAGTISEVAYKTGFKSPSHFSTAFRKVYGVSPSVFAKNRR